MPSRTLLLVKGENHPDQAPWPEGTLRTERYFLLAFPIQRNIATVTPEIVIAVGGQVAFECFFNLRCTYSPTMSYGLRDLGRSRE